VGGTISIADYLKKMGGPIASLREHYRCIAPDHLGFGLSENTGRPADYHPAAHAENFAALMDQLDLNDAVLVFSDWGGPIALNYARLHPETRSQ
jgi:pimeloyl-ACP methyl ester carboxylesterase